MGLLFVAGLLRRVMRDRERAVLVAAVFVVGVVERLEEGFLLVRAVLIRLGLGQVRYASVGHRRLRFQSKTFDARAAGAVPSVGLLFFARLLRRIVRRGEGARFVVVALLVGVVESLDERLLLARVVEVRLALGQLRHFSERHGRLRMMSRRISACKGDSHPMVTVSVVAR